MNQSNTFYEHYSLLVILGHYGSGKTNLALNLAVKLKDLGRKPTIVDLDVVNPYFRSTDYQELTEAAGIQVTGPVFGSSNLDVPSLAPGIDTLIKEASLERPVILDVGGDPDGARALVRYAPAINRIQNKLVLLVVNAKRPETQSLEGNLEILRGLNATVSLPVDALIGNTHLAEFTTVETVEHALPLLDELSLASSLPLIAVTLPKDLEVPSSREGLYLQVERLVKTNWQ
jgi:hypothetical protein